MVAIQSYFTGLKGDCLSLFLPLHCLLSLTLGFNHYRFTLSSAMPSPSQPFALLMDSLAAKDLGCLLGGYYKLLVDPSVSVFRLGRPKVRVHRIPAEEGVCGRFAVIEGVCYESLSSEQKLFHFN